MAKDQFKVRGAHATCDSCERTLWPADIIEQLTPDEQRQFLLALMEQMEHKDLLAHIKDLDAHVSDWLFTLELATHFDLLRDAYHQETKNDAIAQACRPRVG